MADYLPPIVARIEGEDASLIRTFEHAKAEARKFKDELGKLKAVIDVDVRLKDGALAALRQRIADSPAARLDVDLRLKTGTLTTLRGKVKDSAAARLDVSATLTAGTLAALRQDVRDSPAAKLDVNLRLADDTLAAIRQKVADSPAARLKVKLDLATGQREALQATLADREVTVRVLPKVDPTAQRRVEAILREIGKDIRVRVRPTVDTADQQRAEERLARLSRDRTAIIRTRVIGGGTPSGGSGGADGARGGLQALISLGPALAPIGAYAASVATEVAAAGLAVGAFGAAVIPQIKALGNVSDAQQKYNKAVAQYGTYSAQAQKAQAAYAQTLGALPPQTRAAAVAFADFKDDFKRWSDGLSGFTMAPVEKSFAVLDAVLPKTSPMVREVSGDLDRLVTIAGGAVGSPGFDAFAKRVTNFADGVLHRATDDVVHFARVLSEGSGGDGPVAQFLRYAHDQGPAVRQTLDDLGRAVANILKASAEAGPGMLTFVDDVARLVAALPPSFVARAMEAYTVFRLYKLASGPVTSLAGSVTTLSGRLVAMRTASVAAGGGIRGVGAAVGTLSTAAKVGGALAAVAGIALVVDKLTTSSKKAPDVDRMTTAIGQLGATGKTSGELTRVFGTDLDGLDKAIERVSGKASGMDHFNDIMNRVFTLGMGQSNSMKEAKKDIDAIDKGLASLVSNGHADQAAAALADLAKAGHKLPKDKLDDYTSALADQAFQDKLTAQSMGIFGDQAQQVQKRLDAQKQAADGLTQSVQALDQANQDAYNSETRYHDAIGAVAAAVKQNGKTLDVNTDAGRRNRDIVSAIASATDDYTNKLVSQGASWKTVNSAYQDGHQKLIQSLVDFGANREAAAKLADQLVHMPKEVAVSANIDDLKQKLADAKKRVDGLPKSARTTANFDYRKAMADVQFYQRAIDMLHGKTITVTINGVKTGVNASQYYSQGPHKAYGGVIRAFDAGGTVPGYAPMRDTVAAVLSPGEGVLVPEATRALGGESGINAINRQARSGGSLSSGSLSGGMAPIGREVAAGLWQGLQSQQGWLAAQARAFALSTIPQPMADALGIASPSKVAMSLGRWVGAGMVQGLTGSTASVKSATLRLTRSIEQVFHDDAQRQLASDRKSLENLAGAKGKKAARERADLLADMKQQQKYLSEDSAISRFVAVDNQRLLKLAAQRDSVASKLKTAQANLSSLQKQWTSERDQVASQILQGASVVTAAPQPGFALTATDVVNSLRDQAGKASTFAAELRQLQKAGLRSDLIAQIAAAGVDQGGATAAALAGASKDTIKQLNSIQSSLASSANATGAAVADSMYKAGIDSAKGLIKGLQSQESAIEKQMLKIAKSMQTAIREALGIHSPSTVMAMDGENTGRGFALGLDRSVKHVQIAASGLAMAARQGATITGTGGGYRGGDTYNVTVHVHGNVTAERQLVETVREGIARGGLRNNNIGLTPRR